MSAPGPMAELMGRLAYEFNEIQPMIPTYLHLIVSSLFPIYAGAHASLSRPSSAAKPEKRRKSKTEADEDEEEEEEVRMEGLSPSDAIMMPLLAGTTLAGLYFIIKWLQDPAILNKILNWYFAVFGVLSVSKMIADGLQVAHSFIFPKVYVVDGIVYQVNGKERKAVPVAGDNLAARQERNSPLPGGFSRLYLSQKMLDILWADRELPSKKVTIKAYVRRLVSAKTNLGLHGALGLFLGVTAVLYFNFVGKPWWLTNLMAFGFAYGALQIMSPTTFATGSLILGALFFYDIYFVFYTPIMVTVAKTLDIPIKLVFPRPPTIVDGVSKPNHAMLGLGDVVLPGIMVGLALRFDLYMHYLRQQTSIQSETTDSTSPAPIIKKAKYLSPSGKLGDQFWTSSWFGRSLLRPPQNSASSSTTSTPSASNTSFPKPYFTASIIGYILGMLCTLAVMHVFGHAQPALLYLVPGVVGSIWLTALLRGEINEAWEFSEAVEDEETEDSKGTGKPDEKKKKNTNTKANARESFFSFNKMDRNAAKLEHRLQQATGSPSAHIHNEKTADVPSRSAQVEDNRQLVYFSIALPEQKSTSPTAPISPVSDTTAGHENPAGKENRSPRWRSRSPEPLGEGAENGRAEKRLRVG